LWTKSHGVSFVVYLTTYFGSTYCAISNDRASRDGQKSDEVAEGWRKLRNVELGVLHYYPSIIRMLKSRRMRGVGHVARFWKRGTHISYWWKSPRKETTRKTKM
jgi:hypothetical protein